MKPKKLCRLLCLILLASAADASARGVVPYVYTAYHAADGASSISIGTSPPAVYVGHAGRGAKFCPESESFYCLESVVFDFSVPKGELHDGMRWERNGASYRVTNSDEMQVFDRTIEVHAIEEVVEQQRVAIFLYSQRDGVVGFSLLNGGAWSPMYLLRGRRGFPF